MMAMDDRTEAVALVERDLKQVFGARLKSLVTYGGSHAPAREDGHHDHAHGDPVVRTMAMVETLTADDLHACARRASAWHDKGLATPLLLAAGEFEASLDAFPLEFGAIIADHTLVFGASPFEDANVEAADLRRACEVQARSHLVHLRQGYVDAHDNANALAVMIVHSAPSFAALLGNVEQLQGKKFGDPSGVTKLVHVHEISGDEAVRIFPGYLEAVEHLVKLVDSWGTR
jgi:hypothetical protein